MLTHVLNRLVEKEDPEFKQGHDYLVSQNAGKMDVAHFNVMLKSCDNSEEMRKLIDTEMKDAGVRPSVATFTMLARQLMVEGDAKAAHNVVYNEMPVEDVSPNRQVWNVLNMSSAALGSMRVANLLGLLGQGS